MVNDGRKAFNHITDGDGQILNGCSVPDLVNTDASVKVKLIYTARQLEIQYEPKPMAGWVRCFVAENVQLPERGYLAVSASTGLSTAEHKLFSITTATIPKPSGFHAEHVKRSSVKSLFFVASVIAFLYLLVSKVAFPVYRKWTGAKNDSFDHRLAKMYGAF